jgi:hypothetical protein
VLVKSAPLTYWILPALITVLALFDGGLHLALDSILFRGNFFGSLGPPPGAAPPASGAPRPPGPPVPLPLPLNQMFVLNFVGYLVLIALFWFVIRRFGSGTWWMDALFIVYVAMACLAWLDQGRPNPRNLGYLSKSVEVALLLLLLTHMWLLLKPRRREAGYVVASG